MYRLERIGNTFILTLTSPNGEIQFSPCRLSSLPMPTIATINGHAASFGFIFALSHDYIIMRKDKGFLYH
ncbi:hypothetical protein RJ641_036100 [Dillenia turbinata]|uniref:Uncharacterized protein n=1 Tax=Dillenia turbinata TaxID=194707 RepID=A0AAN8VP52_9MAGN